MPTGLAWPKSATLARGGLACTNANAKGVPAWGLTEGRSLSSRSLRCFRINLSPDQQQQLKARVQTARVARDSNKERREDPSSDNDAGPLRAGDRVAVTDLGGAPQEGREGMLRGVVRLSGGEERCVVDLDVLEPSPAEIQRFASLPLDEATHLLLR